MKRTGPQTLHALLTRASLLTTLVALLLAAGLILGYEVLRTRTERNADLRAQADIVAHAASAALLFNDPQTATRQLGWLRQKAGIELVVLFGPGGISFAHYRAADAAAPLPASNPLPPGSSRIVGAVIEISHPIVHDGETLGSVFLQARHGMFDRIASYALILLFVVGISLGLALLVFGRLQRVVTVPLAQVADVARQVMERRDWSLRAPATGVADIAVLVGAFNAMLAEVEQRTRELERESAERARAEAGLRSADRRKDEFLATLAHELRNPLAPMTNAVQLLQRADLPPPLRERSLQILDRQLRHTVRLIDDLLDVSRITTGKLSLLMEPVDLRAVVRGAVELIEPVARAGQLVLAVDVGMVPCRLTGDPARLLQVASNLLTNACRYTPAGGRIWIGLECDGDEAVLTVRDTGVGVEPEMQQRIFELFEQADKGLERGNSGLGIGLTLARQLVQLHGGEIGVHSDGRGLGSTFTVRLPRQSATAAAREAPQDADAVPSAPGAGPDGGLAGRPAPGALSILLADDNLDYAASLAESLRLQGHEVQVVHDGRDALRAAMAAPPDLAVLDIGMPGLNGYAVASRLRDDERTAGTALFAVTGWGQVSDRQRALQAGFDVHFVKPVTPQELLAGLARVQRPTGAPRALPPAHPAWPSNRPDAFPVHEPGPTP